MVVFFFVKNGNFLSKITKMVIFTQKYKIPKINNKKTPLKIPKLPKKILKVTKIPKLPYITKNQKLPKIKKKIPKCSKNY